ncbi:DUF3558 domain-containing protein [Streptomyces apocyni]|uniref:DUF3558 domain-containing protein n=1 Tax=Streptomyces apocyni TaxID=2654677 RepID=UPI0012EADFF9|nr:DUF3558 domain-containing protein [Streptomyces apocyni]
MHRSAPRITRILAACAAVPVMLAAAGCSLLSSDDGGSGNGDGKKDSGAQSSAAPDSSASNEAPAVKEGAFKVLPEACETLAGKTIDALVPEADPKSGKSGQSDNINKRARCTWNGADHKGTKGSQYRWLAVSLQRFDSHQTFGSGDDQAKAQLAKKAAEPEAGGEAKNLKSKPLKGVGDEAVLLTFDVKKKEGDFKDQRIVARVENALLVLDYSGAGLAGAKTPDAAEMTKDATSAAEEAAASIAAANEAADADAKDDDKSSKKPAADDADDDAEDGEKDSKKDDAKADQ